MPLVIMENTCQDIASVQLGIVDAQLATLGILLLVPYTSLDNHGKWFARDLG